MADAVNALPPSKKRAAGRELSRDNPELDEEAVLEQETGTFPKASDDVLATRRIVKVRRHQTTAAPSSNPFAAIRLVPPSECSLPPAEISSEAKADGENTVFVGKKESSEDREKPEDENEKLESKTDEPVVGKTVGEEKNGSTNEVVGSMMDDKQAADDCNAENGEKGEGDPENKDPSAENTNLSSFQQLSSSQNAFTGLAGSGFSSSTFSFGSTIPKDGVAAGVNSDCPSASKNEQSPTYPSFGFGLHNNNGDSSLFGSVGVGMGVSIMSKSGDSVQSMKEVPVETGEEDEEAIFQADSVLFEFIDGGWKERGKGEIKVNISKSKSERARLVMRARGNYRLILNASLYTDMKLTNMEKKGITFACVNTASEGKQSLSTFALKFKDSFIVERFRVVVAEHTGKVAAAVKTPENSPKASED